MKLRLALIAATALALPVAAHAQPVTGPYVNLEGGTSILNPTNFSDSLGQTGKILYKPDYAGIGGAGFGFGNGFRIEIDGDYLHNTVSKIDFAGGGSGKLVGRENRYGPLINVLYDIPVGLPVFPYVGAGGGYQYAQGKYTGGSGIGGLTKFSGSEGSAAYDIIAGLAYPIDAVPGLSFTAEYRFIQDVQSYKYVLTRLGGIPLGTPGAGTAKLGQESSHTFMLGLRYQIFPAAAPMAPAPTPAPVVAPPAPPARTYLVFFDWDKYNLTPRATQIIAQAASDSHTSATTTIDVSGYTDTSGTPVYNQGLSERRAKAVAAQLVADGVPASEIAIHAYGETHLLVPTGPGVREPQNRRVEIVLQ
jgi:outer membrane protein OmpA-like peptidoglycan-associated protein